MLAATSKARECGSSSAGIAFGSPAHTTSASASPRLLLSREGMRVAVAVPCGTAAEAASLPRCLESIAAQTLPPAGVAVCWGRGAPSPPPAADLAARFPSLNLLVQRSSGEAGEAAEAAETAETLRREAGALAASSFSADVISFFEADAAMHPQRLELVRRAFVWLPGRRVVLHACAAAPAPPRHERFDVVSPWPPPAEVRGSRRGAAGSSGGGGSAASPASEAHTCGHASFAEKAAQASFRRGAAEPAAAPAATAYIEQPLSWKPAEA
jgi:hypothetical protein